MKPQPSDAELVTLLRQVLPGVDGAWLFGSAARGQLRADSDVDIAVWHREPLSASQRFDMAQHLAQALGRDVDLLDFRRLSTLMQAQIVATGRRLFTDDPVAEEHAIAAVLRDYLDLQIRRAPLVHDLRDRLHGAVA